MWIVKINNRSVEKRFVSRLRLIKTVLGLARIVRGKPITRLINWLCYFGSESDRLQIVSPYGKDMLIHLDVQSWVERKIMCKGYYEPWVSDFIKRSLKPGQVAIDIGANIGCHTLVMANCVGENGRVLAFEPNPKMLVRLDSNIRLNGFTQVETFAMALGEQTGRGSIFIPPESDHNQGVASMHRSNLGGRGEEVLTEVQSLDDVVGLQKLHRIDLIKMDVEGHEWQVLLGAKQTLKRFKPILLFEFSKQQWHGAGFSAEQVEDLLSELGYKLYVLREQFTMSIRHGVPEHADLLALPCSA